MGFIDYMILSERFQGIRLDCVRPTLVDAAILIKSIVPIALAYLFEIKLLVAFAYRSVAPSFSISISSERKKSCRWYLANRKIDTPHTRMGR